MSEGAGGVDASKTLFCDRMEQSVSVQVQCDRLMDENASFYVQNIPASNDKDCKLTHICPNRYIYITYSVVENAQ